MFFFDSHATLDHFYYTIDEMTESDVVDTIVKGIITDIDYVYDGEFAQTILTVNVLESYKGKGYVR